MRISKKKLFEELDKLNLPYTELGMYTTTERTYFKRVYWDGGSKDKEHRILLARVLKDGGHRNIDDVMDKYDDWIRQYYTNKESM